MNEKNVRWLILVLVALPIGAAVWFCDSIYASRDQSKLDQCLYHLKSIARGYAAYKSDHGGAPPKKLTDLKSEIDGRDATFVCPSGQPGDNYDPPFGGDPASYGYDYHYLTSSGADQIVCSDPKPHEIRHIVFKFLNQEVRNVMYADGRVVTLPETEFESIAPSSKPAPHK